jgi:hypothetical protein
LSLVNNNLTFFILELLRVITGYLDLVMVSNINSSMQRRVAALAIVEGEDLLLPWTVLLYGTRRGELV